MIRSDVIEIGILTRELEVIRKRLTVDFKISFHRFQEVKDEHVVCTQHLSTA